MKPDAPACERNKGIILEVLRDAFADVRRVLEIGSGTGQHAVWFGQHMPWLKWYTSDLAVNHPGINAWLAEAALANVYAPLQLDVSQPDWTAPAGIDAIFSANSLHIMSAPCVEAFFDGVARHLAPGGALCIYGPFNYDGRYTSDSNANFDQWLRQRDPRSAIRDFEWVNQLAEQANMVLFADTAMPANNRLLHWTRR